jgi:very-short-patch-repair endonuclease
VAELAARQFGVVSLDELRACGLTREAVRVRVRGGRLHRRYAGVYAVGHAGLPLEGDFLAAVKACGPGAVLSHFSAAALFGLIRWEDRWPEVTVTSAGTRLQRGLLVHRTRPLHIDDVARVRGIPVTSPARTLMDLATVLEYRPLRRAVREAMGLRLVSLRRLSEVLARLRPRRGAAKFARVLATGYQPTRSELEDVVLDLLLTGGFAAPAVNVPLVIAGRRVVPDFRWPEQHLVLEADGGAWHDHKLAREDDAERQALLEAYGERVLRVTWQQAMMRRPQTLARVRAAGGPVSTPSA